MTPIEWVYLIVMLVIAIYSWVNRPKPQNAKPPALADFDVPTAEEGREVCKVFGTVWIDDPNVLWFGDLRYTPIQASGGK